MALKLLVRVRSLLAHEIAYLGAESKAEAIQYF